jgi:hypothetical protein
VGFQDLIWKAYVSNLKHETHNPTPNRRRQSGAAGLPISSPRQRVQNIATAPLKFTPPAAHLEPSGGRSQGELLSIQLAALQLLPRRIAGLNTPANTNANKEPLSTKKAPSSIQPQPKGAEDKKEKRKHRVINACGVATRRRGMARFCSAIGRQARNIPPVANRFYWARAQKV